MPRKQFIRSSDYPYHITARCINKDWFRIPIDIVWTIFSDYLFFINHAYKVRIISFVLMNNHFHLLISTPEANLDQAMNYLMRETSKRITDYSKRINQTFGAPYHWSLIKEYDHLLHAYRYVYQNPIRANITQKAEDYRYSSLNGLLGFQPLHFPCHDDILFEDTHEKLEWLNQRFSPEQIEQLNLGLKKSEFKLPRSRIDGKRGKGLAR